MTDPSQHVEQTYPVLSPEAEAELTFGEKLLAVFAMDAAGNIQPFKAQDVQEVPFEPGLPVKKFQGISFINGNPRCCFVTTDGDRRCFRW